MCAAVSSSSSNPQESCEPSQIQNTRSTGSFPQRVRIYLHEHGRHPDYRNQAGNANSRTQMLESCRLANSFGLSGRFATLLETQTLSGQTTCVNCAVFDGKRIRQLSSPLRIRRRTVLPRVAFNRGHSRNSRCQTARMQERRTWTGQILHAQKHAKLLSRRRHHQ